MHFVTSELPTIERVLGNGSLLCHSIMARLTRTAHRVTKHIFEEFLKANGHQGVFRLRGKLALCDYRLLLRRFFRPYSVVQVLPYIWVLY